MKSHLSLRIIQDTLRGNIQTNVLLHNNYWKCFTNGISYSIFEESFVASLKEKYKHN